MKKELEGLKEREKATLRKIPNWKTPGRDSMYMDVA